MQTKELVEYRKTATIRAEQYLGQHVAGVCTGGQGCQSRGAPDGAVPHIHTLEGDLTVSHGDWIATGVQGEHWAIKPDVFAASYVPVEQGLPTSSGGRGEAWRTVPVEPTEAMIEAALDRPFVRDKSMYELIYRAMIDAAPLPSSPSQGGCEDLVEASQSLRSVPQSAVPETWRQRIEPLGYTATFWAIAAAVTWREHHSFGISVERFLAALPTSNDTEKGGTEGCKPDCEANQNPENVQGEAQMAVTLKPKACDCGQTPKVVSERVSEDLYETRVQCACGLRADEVEHHYPDSQTAIWNWNDGQRKAP